MTLLQQALKLNKKRAKAVKRLLKKINSRTVTINYNN